MMQHFVLNIPASATQHPGIAGGGVLGVHPFPCVHQQPNCEGCTPGWRCCCCPIASLLQPEPGLRMRLIGSEALSRLVLRRGVIPTIPHPAVRVPPLQGVADP